MAGEEGAVRRKSGRFGSEARAGRVVRGGGGDLERGSIFGGERGGRGGEELGEGEAEWGTTVLDEADGASLGRSSDKRGSSGSMGDLGGGSIARPACQSSWSRSSSALPCPLALSSLP